MTRALFPEAPDGAETRIKLGSVALVGRGTPLLMPVLKAWHGQGMTVTVWLHVAVLLEQSVACQVRV